MFPDTQGEIHMKTFMLLYSKTILWMFLLKLILKPSTKQGNNFAFLKSPVSFINLPLPFMQPDGNLEGYVGIAWDPKQDYVWSEILYMSLLCKILQQLPPNCHTTTRCGASELESTVHRLHCSTKGIHRGSPWMAIKVCHPWSWILLQGQEFKFGPTLSGQRAHVACDLSRLVEFNGEVAG